MRMMPLAQTNDTNTGIQIWSEYSSRTSIRSFVVNAPVTCQGKPYPNITRVIKLGVLAKDRGKSNNQKD